jgi:hypothetical protein
MKQIKQSQCLVSQLQLKAGRGPAVSDIEPEEFFVLAPDFVIAERNG